LNTVDEGAEVTLGGRLFHARAAITRNERPPIMQRCIRAWSVVGESWNVDVALLPRWSSAGHGRGTEVPNCDDSGRRARPVGSVFSQEPMLRTVDSRMACRKQIPSAVDSSIVEVKERTYLYMF